MNGSLDSPGLPVGFPARAFFSPQTSFIDGWSAVAGYDGSYSGSVEYIDGANRGIAGAFVELGYYFGLNAIEQTFSTLPDQSYLVSFWLATDPYNGPPARVRVIVDGTIADFDAPAGTSTGMSMGWRQESFSFVSAGSGSSTLWFGNLIGIPAIDNVQVVLVPEPGLLAWFGLTAMLLFVSGKTDRLR